MDWTGIGPTMGPIAGEFICYVFLVCTRPSTISSRVYFFVLGRVGSLLRFMHMLGYGVLHIQNLLTLWILCMWRFIQWIFIYLFKVLPMLYKYKICFKTHLGLRC